MQKHYNTQQQKSKGQVRGYKPAEEKKIEGQVFCYRPYPPENKPQQRQVTWFTVVLIVILAGLMTFMYFAIGRADSEDLKCWALCQPGDRVNLRLRPDKDSTEVGWLECGDSFHTDGTSRNGWIRVLDAGECECWIYSGYVVTDEPVETFENYVCVARNRVACRRWVDGPQIRINGRLSWLKNGSDVSVFYIAGEWAVTSRGYIKAEWLEVDPG